MEIFVDRIEVHVPNSEALIEAQHYGIKDRTVGQYYMSEKSNEVIGFLNNLQGVFYLDFHISRSNIIALIEKLKDNRLENCFKTNLISQYSTLKTIDWLITKDHLYEISPPSINENNKYLKFDLTNTYQKCFFRLCLGDLTKIVIRKMSSDCFVIYLDENGTFQSKLDNNEFNNWEINNETSNSF
jgi:hypothetical protein